MPNFYKSGGSYYTADTNTRIADVNALQGLAKAGGKEVSAPQVTPAPIAPIAPVAPNMGNKMDSSTLSLGIKASSVFSSLPKDPAPNLINSAQSSADLATQKIADLQKQVDSFKNTNEQQLKDQVAAQQANQTSYANQSTDQMNAYNNQMTPMRNEVVNFAQQGIDATTAQNAQDIVNKKIALNNDVVSYANLAKQSLDGNYGIGDAATINGRKNADLNNYKSKIDITNAAIAALDGNLNMANTILDNTSKSLQSNISQQINFNNMVNQLFDNKITDSKNIVAGLNQQISDIEKNKATIQSLMETNPIIANKADLALTDTPDQLATKLNSFYVKNPQYTPDNQAWIKAAREKYTDVGISMDDSVEAVTSKILRSKIFGKDTENNPKIAEQLAADSAGYTIDSNGKLVSKTAGIITDSTGNSYDITDYASDPKHENLVKSLLLNMGQFKSLTDIADYIHKVAPDSPITADMIANSAEKYGVSWEAMTAIMQQDSSLGTAGLAVNSKNPGNVGTYGNKVGQYKTWQAGVDAVAQWLSNHKSTIDTSSNDIVNSYVDNLKNGVLTSMTAVPPNLRNKVSLAISKTPTDSFTPTAVSKFTMASNRIVSNYIALPQYQLTANGLPYLQRIDAAMKTPGSISDQDLLDSLTKLNTSGNAISDAQVRLITDGKSFADTVSTFSNKFINGGVLSDNQRQQIQTIAKAIFANYQSGYQPVYDQVSAQLEQSGIPKQFWTLPDLNNLSAGSVSNSGVDISHINFKAN